MNRNSLVKINFLPITLGQIMNFDIFLPVTLNSKLLVILVFS